MMSQKALTAESRDSGSGRILHFHCMSPTENELDIRDCRSKFITQDNPDTSSHLGQQSLHKHHI